MDALWLHTSILHAVLIHLLASLVLISSSSIYLSLLPLLLSFSLSLPLFHRLRTLSSGGGNKNPSSGSSGVGKSGGGGEGGIPPLKHSQSHNSFVSPVKQLPSPGVFSGYQGVTASTKKFPLAKHRYGKEELLQLFTDDVQRPSNLPDLLPLTRTQLLTPLSFMPLSEEEQVSSN